MLRHVRSDLARWRWLPSPTAHLAHWREEGIAEETKGRPMESSVTRQKLIAAACAAAAGAAVLAYLLKRAGAEARKDEKEREGEETADMTTK